MIVALVLIIFGSLCFYLLTKSWRRTNPVQKIALILVSLTFMSLANLCFASELSYELYGGEPEAGKIEGGRFFVGNHGRYPEVSEQFYRRDILYKEISSYVVGAGIITSAAAIWFARRFKLTNMALDPTSPSTIESVAKPR